MFKKVVSSLLMITALNGLSVSAVRVLANTVPEVYTVQKGDSLWLIEQKYKVPTADIKRINALTTDSLFIGQQLKLKEAKKEYITYTVQSGDSLWLIAQKYQISIEEIKKINQLQKEELQIGQVLRLNSDKPIENNSKTKDVVAVTVAASVMEESPSSTVVHKVQNGDNLWDLSVKYKVTVQEIQTLNKLKTDALDIGQILYIPVKGEAVVENNNKQTQVPDFYIVKEKDTLQSIAAQFNSSVAQLRQYNNLQENFQVKAGNILALKSLNNESSTTIAASTSKVSQEQPRGENIVSSASLVNWFTEVQNKIKINDVFTITDVDTKITMKFMRMSGTNHADVEPFTKADTEVMKELFGEWQWTPRAVIVTVGNQKIAASLSGMPHDIESIKDNDFPGHADLYFEGSLPHGSGISESYVQQHRNMVQKAAKSIQ